MRLTIQNLALVALVAGCGEVTGSGDPDAGGNPAESPAISSVAPDRGALAGETEVVITGTGFGEDSQVVVGSLQALSVTVDSDTQLTITTPPGTVPGEPVDIIVFNGAGFSTMPAAFTYNPLPQLTSVEPDIGPSTGGISITAKGVGLMANSAGIPQVEIAGVAATDVTVVDDETITFTLPAAGALRAFERQPVSMTNANGSAMLVDAFRYSKPGLLAGTTGRSTNGRPTVLYHLDPVTGEISVVTELLVDTRRLMPSADGTIYTVGYSKLGNSGLAALDPASGTFEYLGRLPDRYRGMTVHGSNLYGLDYTADCDPSPCVYTMHTYAVPLATLAQAQLPLSKAGQTSPDRGACMAVRDDESLYAVADFTTSLETITVADGARSNLVALSPSVEANCHGMEELGGSVFALRFERSNGRKTTLVQINPFTGAVTEIATDLPELRGLMKTPAGW